MASRLQHGQVAAEYFLARVSGNFREHSIHVDDLGLTIDDGHALSGVFKSAGEQCQSL